MEIRITAKQMLQVLNILSWIIFLGLCVDAGAIIVNTVITIGFNPAQAALFWDADLSGLYQWDRGYFLVETFIMTLVSVMQVLLFYLIVKLLHNQKLDMNQPFSQELLRFTWLIAYLSLGIGLFAHYGNKLALWFISLGVPMPNSQSLGLDGGDVWLFMGVVLLVISQIFKRGIEIQTENELTV